MIYMAKRLERTGDIATWQNRENKLIQHINDRLYDKKIGCYVDVTRETGDFSDVVTPASLMPLYIHIADAKRAESLAKIAGSEKYLYPGMPSAAYGHKKYQPQDYWRGPMWLNIAYFALKGLKWYGYTDIAEAGKKLILTWCEQNSDSIYEYYNSRTGQGLGKSQYGWSSSFIIQFLMGWEDQEF
jgi:putative isomerase